MSCDIWSMGVSRSSTVIPFENFMVIADCCVDELRLSICRGSSCGWFVLQDCFAVV